MKTKISILITTLLALPTALASSENGAAWSPNNQHIALHSNKEGGSQLFLVDTKTDQWEQITESGFSRHPSWSNDGKTLVFMGWQDDDKGFSTYKMNFVDRKVQRLSSDDKVHLGPSISPDGTKVAYCVFDKGPQLWLMDINGKNLKRISTGKETGCWPKWLPDNQTLIFTSPSKSINSDFDIASLNIKTGMFSYIFESTSNDWAPTYNAHNNRVYFLSLKDSKDKNMMTGQWNIYSMTLNGKDIQLEVEDTAFDSTINASNNGQYLAYAQIKDKEHKVSLLNVRTKETIAISQN